MRKRKLWLALIGMLSVVAVAELGGNGDFTVRRWVFGDFGGTVMVKEWTQDYGGCYLAFYSGMSKDLTKKKQQWRRFPFAKIIFGCKLKNK